MNPEIKTLRKVESDLESLKAQINNFEKMKTELENRIKESYIHTDHVGRIFDKIRVSKFETNYARFYYQYRGYDFYMTYYFGHSQIHIQSNHRDLKGKHATSFYAYMMEIDNDYLLIEDCIDFQRTFLEYFKDKIGNDVDSIMDKKHSDRKVIEFNGVKVYDYNENSGFFPVTITFDSNYEFCRSTEKWCIDNNVQHEMTEWDLEVEIQNIEMLTLLVSDSDIGNFDIDMSVTKYWTSSDSHDGWYIDLNQRDEWSFTVHTIMENIKLRDPAKLEEYLKSEIPYGWLKLVDAGTDVWKFTFYSDVDDYGPIGSGEIFKIDKHLTDANVGVRISEEFMEKVYSEDVKETREIHLEIESAFMTPACLETIKTHFIKEISNDI